MRGLVTVMWKLSIEDDQGATTVVQLVRSEYTLGRGEENTVRLTERNISRRHARLVKQGTSWFLVDVGSYNGCFANGNRAGESHPVGPRDLIQIGDYRLEFITDETPILVGGDDPNDTLTSEVPAPLLSSGKDRLVMVVGPTPGREYILNEGRQTLGRSDACDLPINHASVSRVHAEIHYLEDNRYEIIDKKSSNGLRINGVELAQGLIEARDVVEFGDIVLRLIPAGQLYRPTPEETQKIAALLGVGDNAGALSHSMRLGLAWSSMSRSVRFGVSVLGCLVVLMFAAVVVTGRTGHMVGILRVGASPASATDGLLQDARELALAGKVEEAHAELLRIPADSKQTLDPVFKEIEAKWADALFERAARATTTEEKRAILDTIVKERNIDTDRRGKALDNLSTLHDNVLAVDELPKSRSARTMPTGTMASKPAGAANTNTSNLATNAGRSGTTSSAAVAANGARSPSAKTLNPLAAPAPQAAEPASSNELAQVLARKNALRAKVAAGTATDQERRLLRALCRQLNDTSCSR